MKEWSLDPLGKIGCFVPNTEKKNITSLARWQPDRKNKLHYEEGCHCSRNKKIANFQFKPEAIKIESIFSCCVHYILSSGRVRLWLNLFPSLPPTPYSSFLLQKLQKKIQENPPSIFCKYPTHIGGGGGKNTALTSRKPNYIAWDNTNTEVINESVCQPWL